MNITKAQYKKALVKGKIYITGVKYTSDGWTQFRVWHNTPDGLVQIMGDEGTSYWDSKDYVFECIAWGTDRRLEIILAIGYSLGLAFHDIRQNYTWLSWES